MHSKDYIPKGYSERYSWLYNLRNYVETNTVRFGVTQAETMPFSVLIAAFGTASTVADAPNAGAADRLERKEKAAAVTAAARWENTRGERGPLSTIHEAIIP